MTGYCCDLNWDNSRLRAADLVDRKPKKKKCGNAIPAADKAHIAALAPGIGITG